MKVLMINVVCGIRSTGRICTDLATALEAQGHEVKIAYGRENVPEQFHKYAVKIGSDLDVKLHGVKARLLDGCGFGSKRATKKFIEWVKEYDPDVIHLHNIHGYFINVDVLFRYLKACGKKVIWTLHDCWSFTGHTVYCDSANCKRWVEGCHDCPLIRAYPTSFVDRSHHNWLEKSEVFTGVPNMTIITPSKWLASRVNNSFLKEYSVKVINNGIDTSQFYPIESDFKKKNGIADKFVLLGVATAWDEMKGLADYLELADLLGDDYKIVLVGLTKKQLEKLPKNVLGIERTGNIRELAEIYTTADLFLNLSYCENYPTVNIESMACGTPVLTYNTGGSPEIVSEYNGYVVEQGDISEVAEVIQNIKTDGVEKVYIDRKRVDNVQVTENYLKLYVDKENTVNKRLKVLFLTNVPSPYRVHFFNKLGNLCDLTVLYQKSSSSERNSKWKTESQDTYRSILLKGKNTGVDNAFCPEVVKYLERNYDVIVICGNASPTEILAIEWCKLRKIPYCIEGDGAFVKSGNGMKEKLKKHLISGGDLFFSTCKEHDKYYIHYGADPSRLVRYRFSSLLRDDIIAEKVTAKEKVALRVELGIKEDKIILAVGQFIYRKGFDVLLKAATRLPSDIGVYIIGDNPREEYLSFIRDNYLTNVHFEGFKTKDILKKYYKAADVFVLPTREDIWGLVVNEAMASGLPVITTDRCNAGLELIENGVNGYIVPVDDSVALRNAIDKVISVSEQMGENALRIISGYTIENMVSDHLNVFQGYHHIYDKGRKS